MDDLLAAVLVPPLAQSFEDLASWWRDHLAATAEVASTIDRAILGALRVDRIGFAFACGYQAALRALVPSLPGGAMASLAASEAGGAHPRAIHCRLIPDGAAFHLEGRKEYVSGGPAAAVLLVVAARSERSPPAAHPELVVVCLPPDREGLRFETHGPAPFVPEVPHASLVLDRVRIEAHEVLPGDGYAAYLKPFRTVEDLHVHGALLAHLGATLARASTPDTPLLERLLFALAGARALAREDPNAAGTELALAGLMQQTQALLRDLAPQIASLGDPIASRFERDRALFGVASKVREKRREAAWARLK